MSIPPPTQIPTPNIKSLLIPRITSSKSTIISFLNHIYTVLSKRSGHLFNSFIFQELSQLPMIISEKIFSYLTYPDKTPLSISNFSTGIYNLLYNSIEEKTKLVFKIYDFDKDNRINKNDVKLLLYYFHLIDNTSDTLYKIDIIVDNFFINDDMMNIVTYTNQCFSKNSDIAMLMVVFINKYLVLFKKAEMKLFKKLVRCNSSAHNWNNDEDNKKGVMNKFKNFDVLPHSQCLEDYLVDIKLYEPKDKSVDCDDSGDSIFLSDSEEDKELEELNSFEKDISNVFNKVKNSSMFKLDKTLSPNQSMTRCSLSKFKDEDIKKKAFLHVTSFNVDECRSYSNNNLVNGIQKLQPKNTKNLSVPFFLNSSYQEDSALSSASPASQTNNNNASSINKSLISTNYQSNKTSNKINLNLYENNNNIKQQYPPLQKHNHFQLLKSSTSFSPIIIKEPNIPKKDSNSSTNNNINSISLSSYIRHDLSFNHQVIYLYKYKNDIKTNIQVKYILVNSFIFYFKKRKNNSSFKFIRFIPIIGIYPIIVKINRKLTKLTFNSSIHNHLICKTFIGESNLNAIETFIDKMNYLNGYTSITDDFDLQHEVGKGKFGHVLLARNLKSATFIPNNRNGSSNTPSSMFAVKIIKKNHSCEEEYKINKWETSIFTTLVNVYHPHIIRCYKKYETIDRILFVYDFIEGNDLKTYIKKNADLKRNVHLLKMCIEILDGISYLHKLGIIHRDIKTTNIVVDITCCNSIKILDFGLSKVMGYKEITADPYGSLCFKAPELVSNFSYQFGVDVWAFGVTGYYMLFKQLPFDKGSKNEVKRSIIKGEIVFPVNEFRFVGNEWNEVVLQLVKECLSRDVKGRPTAEDLMKRYKGVLKKNKDEDGKGG